MTAMPSTQIDSMLQTAKEQNQRLSVTLRESATPLVCRVLDVAAGDIYLLVGERERRRVLLGQIHSVSVL